MATKITLQFNWKETRGWTESYYDVSETPLAADFLTDKTQRIARARAACLTRGATILSGRLSNPANPALVRSVELGYPGAGGTAGFGAGKADVVNLAILVNFFSNDGVRRSLLQRGIPDNDITEGIVDFGDTGRGPYNRFWQLIAGTTGLADTLNGPKIDLVSVAGSGTIVTAAAHGLAVGDKVLINSRSSGNGPKVYAKAIVQTVDDATHLTLKKWTRGNCSLGQICKVTTSYVGFSSYQVPNPIYARTRQTGHPFGLLRGRQSTR
jgi:hypothetical protein